MIRYSSLIRSVAWALLIPLSWYIGWVGSVTFVAICSLYANAASDFAAYRGDESKRLARMEQMLEELVGR